MEYLTPDSPDAFLDFPGPKAKPDRCSSDCVVCPRCHGYGGWNLKVNAFGLPKGHDNTPENRQKFVHFRAHCSQCHGYGWTSAEDAKCIHHMQWYQKLGNCYNRYKCTKCDKTEDIDSSD